MIMQTPNPSAVWDLPTRLFHWLLVGLFAFSWWSAETGKMDWHQLSGITILGLLAFRILWGFIGSNTARFGSFLRPPGAVLAYLRSNAPVSPGHNPLGGYSVILLLLVLIAQVGAGLLAVDVDGLESGPLSYLVSFDQGRTASLFHELGFNLLLAVIVLHVLAIGFYRVIRKRDLLTPMLTGTDRQLETAEGALIAAPLWRFMLAAAVAALLAWWICKGLAF
jgi:cytochrome b